MAVINICQHHIDFINIGLNYGALGLIERWMRASCMRARRGAFGAMSWHRYNKGGK
jgi:hypothetical protein